MSDLKRMWRQLDPAFLFLGALFLLQCAFLFLISTPNWDAALYYAYARSAVFDGDLHLENDLRLSYPTAGEHFVAKQTDTILTESNRVVSPYAVGSSILWTPLLGAMRLAMAGTTALGITGEMRSGYEWPYVGAVSALSALLGFLTFWLTYRFSLKIVGRRPALIAAATLMFVTPLLYYQFREPLYAHATSAFIMAVCVVVWWRQIDELPVVSGALLLGGLLGLGILVRWQHAVYCVLPVASAFFWWWRLPSDERRTRWRHPLSYLLLVGIAALIVTSLQMAKWRLFNGQLITVPQGDAFMEWSAPNIVPLLWSTYRGLLAWMPLFLPAIIGLIWLARTHPRLALPLLLVLCLELYVGASTVDWYGGGGYGTRRYTGALLIFGLGYAGFLSILRPRWQLIVGVGLGIVLAWHQWILLRFGLEEQIGGRNVSGYPTFLWEEVSWPTYVGQLAAHVPDLWQQPRAFLVLAGSPIDLLLEHRVVPWEQILSLSLAALFVLGVVWLGRRTRSAGLWPWLIGAALFILLANAWISWFA